MKNKAFIAILGLVVGILASFAGATPVTEASGNCNISSFYAAPQSVVAGGTTTLFLTTSNCQNLTITGGSYSNFQVGYNTSLTVGPLYSSAYYTLTGTDQYGVQTTATTTVSVGNTGVNGSCVISSFYANPTQLASGASSNLYWTTNGCTTVNVSGPGVISSSYSGSISTGPIYGTNTYSITASSYGANTTTQSLTIYPSGGSNNNYNGTATATTSQATNIAGTSATLNGYLATNNNCYSYGTNYCSGSITNYYFLYGTSQYSLTQETPTQTAGSGANNVTAQVYNLVPNTTYYFQLVANNNGTTSNGSVMSFYSSAYNNNYPYPYPTPVVNSAVTAVTSIATEISTTSAQLNGLVTGIPGEAVTAYFEYGTSPSFGSQTAPQSVSAYSVNNYYDTVAVSPSTTYYYRIDGVVNGQVSPGATVSFTTPSTNVVYVAPTVYTHTTHGTGNGGGSAYVSLSISDQNQAVFPGNTLSYTVNYQNVSSQQLSGAILNVILPSTVTFQQASQGVLTTNNTVAVTLGTLPPQAQGSVEISVNPNSVLASGTTLVATATLAFTTPSTAQDAAIAYAINSVGNPNANNLAGLAFYGNGFFPNTLFGWVLILGVLLILALMVRYFYHRGNAEERRARPETHIHYATPPATQPITDKYGDPMYH